MTIDAQKLVDDNLSPEEVIHFMEEVAGCEVIKLWTNAYNIVTGFIACTSDGTIITTYRPIGREVNSNKKRSTDASAGDKALEISLLHRSMFYYKVFLAVLALAVSCLVYNYELKRKEIEHYKSVIEKPILIDQTDSVM